MSRPASASGAATSSASSDALDVLLRDGTSLRLRSPVRADGPALAGLLSGLSKSSFYRRFHGLPSVGPKLVEPFMDPDWIECGSLIGELDGDK